MTNPLIRFRLAGLVAAFVFVAGCKEGRETASTAGTSIAPPPAIAGAAGGDNTPVVNVSPSPPPVVPVQPPAISTNSGNTNTGGENSTATPDISHATVAEVGVGAKGRYDSNDYISTVVGRYFGVQQTVAFNLAHKYLNDYKAVNGDYPKTHEQYFKEIIEDNSVRLPELPEGEEYYYDYESAKSTRGEKALFVIQPKR